MKTKKQKVVSYLSENKTLKLSVIEREVGMPKGYLTGYFAEKKRKYDIDPYVDKIYDFLLGNNFKNMENLVNKEDTKKFLKQTGYKFDSYIMAVVEQMLFNFAEQQVRIHCDSSNTIESSKCDHDWVINLNDKKDKMCSKCGLWGLT
jgi:hypothetical protein